MKNFFVIFSTTYFSFSLAVSIQAVEKLRCGEWLGLGVVSVVCEVVLVTGDSPVVDRHVLSHPLENNTVQSLLEYILCTLEGM